MAQRMLTFGLAELKPVIANRHSVLQETEILELFHRQEGIVCDIPFKPKGGEVPKVQVLTGSQFAISTV